MAQFQWGFELPNLTEQVKQKWPYLLYLLFFFVVTKSVTARVSRSWNEWRKGYAAPPRYPQLIPIMGFDIALSMARSLRNHTFLLWLRNLHATGPGKSKTFTIDFLGRHYIHTIEPENMKALSATVWKDFGVEPLRRKTGASMPFADKGVNTTDGHDWEFSRFLIKPYFMREAFSNTDRLKEHTDNLLSLIPLDGSTFDMQTLMQRWFLDTSSHFLFGESINCLLYPERAEIAWAMTDVLRGLRLRLQMSKWLWMFRWKPWFDAIDLVHDFIDRQVDRAYQERAEKDKGNDAAQKDSSFGVELKAERTDLLWSMVGNVPEDRERLRSEMLLLFVPNNDTTSIFISNVFWNLARFPDVYAKVREEVLSLGEDTRLTYEVLRSMKYLEGVLNETHRLYPNGVMQVRYCIRDTTLPLGGGKDGKSPMLVRKGDVVQVNKSVMQRDKDVWGEDADEFKPERWFGLRPYWTFVPFGGGPRRCPAQLLVTTEASYVIAQFCRRFKAVESRDVNGYVPIMRAGPVNTNGVKIAITPA
ncbi:cytochrome P450 [Ustulina deusta]|nr:cytochrome P450 [Ustulina deusta]